MPQQNPPQTFLCYRLEHKPLRKHEALRGLGGRDTDSFRLLATTTILLVVLLSALTFCISLACLSSLWRPADRPRGSGKPTDWTSWPMPATSSASLAVSMAGWMGRPRQPSSTAPWLMRSVHSTTIKPCSGYSLGRQIFKLLAQRGGRRCRGRSPWFNRVPLGWVGLRMPTYPLVSATIRTSV